MARRPTRPGGPLGPEAHTGLEELLDLQCSVAGALSPQCPTHPHIPTIHPQRRSDMYEYIYTLLSSLGLLNVVQLHPARLSLDILISYKKSVYMFKSITINPRKGKGEEK